MDETRKKTKENKEDEKGTKCLENNFTIKMICVKTVLT